MVTFTTLAKNLSLENYYNKLIAGLAKTLYHAIFSAIRYVSQAISKLQIVPATIQTFVIVVIAQVL